MNEYALQFGRRSRGVDRDNSVGDGGEEARARRQEDGRPIPLRRAAEVSQKLAKEDSVTTCW